MIGELLLNDCTAPLKKFDFCSKVHTAEHIVERLELPSDLIRDVSGQVAFEEEASRVQPVDLETVFATSDNSQSKLIKEASANLVGAIKFFKGFEFDQS